MNRLICSAASGDSGPWFYLYWKGDKGEYQEYSFPSFDAQAAFEELCLTLKGAEYGTYGYPGRKNAPGIFCDRILSLCYDI